MDVTAPQFYKREIVRPKYRCVADRAQPPLIAPAPRRAANGGYASAGLLAWTALSKYVDHLPLYRLEQMSARWGAQISRQSMCDWIALTAEWLQPIYQRMHARLLAGDYLQADETPIKCHDPDEKRGSTSQGYLWVISRPHDDVVFDWRLSRRHGELTSLIDGFGGVLQSDAYETYPAFVRANPTVSWVGCWAHARRKYHEAQAESPKAVRVVLRPALATPVSRATPDPALSGYGREINKGAARDLGGFLIKGRSAIGYELSAISARALSSS